jgi:hypothetical protein
VVKTSGKTDSHILRIGKAEFEGLPVGT